MGLGEPRVELDGLLETGDGFVQLALHDQPIAQVAVGCGELCVEFDGLLEAGDGLIQLALGAQRHSQSGVGLGEFRVELDGPPPARDSLIRLALVGEHSAQHGVAHGVRRSKLDGLPVAGDGLVQLALIVQGVAQVGVGKCRVGFEPDLLACGDHSSFQRLLGVGQPVLFQRPAQADQMHGIAGTQSLEIAEQGNGLVVIAALLQDMCQHVGCFGTDGARGGEEANRLVAASLSLQYKGQLEVNPDIPQDIAPGLSRSTDSDSTCRRPSIKPDARADRRLIGPSSS